MNCIHEFCLFLDGMQKFSLFSCAFCALLFTGRRLFLIMLHSQVDIWFGCDLIASPLQMHRRSYCNLLWQTNWLPAHKKQKRKGKECALSILRCSRVNFMREMFSSEKSLNIKVGNKQSKVKLPTLPSSLKTAIHESVLMFFHHEIKIGSYCFFPLSIKRNFIWISLSSCPLWLILFKGTNPSMYLFEVRTDIDG